MRVRIRDFQNFALGGMLGLGIAGGAMASEPDVETIFRHPLVEGTRPSAGKISPDGQWVAYFWNEEGFPRPLNLFVVPAKGGVSRKLTSFASRLPESLKPLSWPAASPGVFAEFSPDSQTILFGYDGDLYLGSVDGRKPQRLTRTEAGESEASWAPDGESILYASGGALYKMSTAGPGIVQLTAPEGKVSHASPKWSPDGSKISFVAQEGEDEHDFLVPFYLDEWVKTKTSKRGYTKNRIGILRAEGGPPTWIEAEKEPIAWLNEVVWSRDSRRILLDYLSKDTKTRTLMVADAELPAAPAETQRDLGRLPSPPEKEKELSIKARQVYREADPKWVYTYDGFVTDTTSSDFSRDASRILFTSEKSGFNQVYSVDVTGKKPKRITRGPGAVDWAGWSYDSRSIVTLASADDPARRSLFIDSLSGKNSIRLQASSTYLTHPVLSRGGDKVLYEGSRMGVPYDYYVADLASRTSVQVTRTVPGSFQSVEPGWVLPRIVSFPSRDGKSLRGLLYQPSQEGTPPGHRPVVIFVHGAGIQQNVVEGWTQYSPNFKFASVLVHRGFVVFEVDYRGSTGYGREFRTDVAGHLGGKDLEDELAGVDYLKTLPFVDPQRIGIYGGSYGGFMAELALFRNPEIFAAGAALRPVADWTNYYRSNVFYCMQRLGSPADHPEAYRISSPVNYAQGLQDPLLLLHGVLDSNVPFQDTVQLTDRLQRYGKPFELMIYPREDHTFTEPENWIDQYNRILDFFVRNLNP